MLYIIRHPAVQPQPGRAAAEWPLSDIGRSQAGQLAALDWWPEVTSLYTSQETKTVEAGSIIQAIHAHLEVVSRPDLNEAARPAQYVTDQEYHQNVARFLTVPAQRAVPGWETAVQAQVRIVAAIEIIRQTTQSQNCALISHGLVLTLYRAHCLGQSATLTDWQGLSMGCWAVLDETGRWVQDWTALESA